MNIDAIFVVVTIFLAVVFVLVALPIRAAYKERERLNSIDLSKEIAGWQNWRRNAKCTCTEIEMPTCPIHNPERTENV